MTLLTVQIRIFRVGKHTSLLEFVFRMKSFRGGGKKSRFKNELDPNQKKITQFFTKCQNQSAVGSGPSSSTPSLRSPYFSNRNSSAKTKPQSWSDDDGDILEVIEVPKPPSSPKELVLIPSSDSEAELEGEAKVNKLEIGCTPPVEGGEIVRNASPFERSDASSSSGDEILSQVDIDEIINSSQESKSTAEVEKSASSESSVPVPLVPANNGHCSPSARSDSSGDEVLSQFDMDEVIRSSQSSLESQSLLSSPTTSTERNKENLAEPPPTFASPPPKVKTPKRSPKSQLNYFSPIRHLKRSSSEASLDSSSPVKKNGTPSPRRNLNFGGGASNGGGGRYYLRNFMTILTEVVGDPFHAHLISDEDHKVVQHFTSLSLDAQSLYVRLFQRKWGWKPETKISQRYKELPEDVSDLCKELTERGFFEQISASNSALEEILDTLDLAKTLALAKKMMVNPGKKTKEACKAALLSKAKNQRTLTGQGSAAIMKTALTELGSAYRVSTATKTLFSRLFILYSPPQYWEVENDQASNQLLVILLNNMGQMEYPTYKIQRNTTIYRTREDLIRFHEAWTLHSNLVAFTELKDWEGVVEVAKETSSRFQELISGDEGILANDLALPQFLRIYTAGSVLCHACWMGVEGFQKQKQFCQANEHIYKLLGQTTYLTKYRGRWYERLIINATHLKKTKEEIRTLIETSLKDEWLQENHKLILSVRLEKVKSSIELQNNKKTKAKAKMVTKRRSTRKRGKKEEVEEVETEEDFVEVETESILEVETLSLKNDIPTRTITGEKMDRGPGNMGKAVFIGRQDSSGSNRMSSVEQHCIQYYLDNCGYTHGIHGEGSTVTTLYGLLFWDVIFYDELPDTFHTRYQPFPLDMHFEDFYERRKDMIEEKLTLIRDVLCMEDLYGIVDEVWEKNEKKLSIVNWSLFEDSSVLKSLMKAMGNAMIANICERLARNYRYAASGFPDLVVWNEKGVLFSEIKGPGDSLSPKQQLWLDFLIQRGIPAEVCHVKAVSNKRIRL